MPKPAPLIYLSLLFYLYPFFLKNFNFMPAFYEWGLTTSRLQSHYEEAVYFLLLSSQKFLVLI